jgi:hypothetical protein
MKKQLTDIWLYAQSVAADEDNLPEPPDFTTIDTEKVKATVDKLNEVLSKNTLVDKKVKAKLQYVTKNYPANIKKYEDQEAVLGERNSYSKTDTDATFMRMKEDHMKNGQLKAAYNVQVTSSNQYIVNYGIYPNTTDTTTLPKHIAQHEASYGKAPTTLTADAGYGSKENYTLLEDKNIKAYVKYGMFDKEQKSNHGNDKPFTADKLFYNKEKDCFICPMGQTMDYIGEVTRKTSTGFIQKLKRYQAKSCFNYPLNGACHKSKTNRTIEINERLQNKKLQHINYLTAKME